MRERAEVKIRAAYKRLETDDEFVERLYKRSMWRPHFKGEKLDEWAWGNYKMQRRIVEDVA